MGAITAGIGLISGIDTAKLIDSLITLESRGKFNLQNRIITLQSQQTAMLDINSRLLNLKNIASSFRTNKIFQSALAISGNESIFTASATNKAQPGTFTFTVKQLVTHSQKLSKGFADTTTTPLGLEFLSFNFGKGNLDRDRDLSELNGGMGVAPGKINITDKAGNAATIDLTDAMSLREVLDRINGSAQIAVEAKIDGDRLTIVDTSGGEGSLTVANAIGSTTASDLGIAGSTLESTLAGSPINVLGSATSLASLNDGLGVLIRNNVPDLQVTARNGAIFNIDLGQVNTPIGSDTLLSALNNGAGVTISGDHDNPDLKIVARDGTEYEINLTGVTTVGELISRVNLETDGHINLSITNGKQLTVTDTLGGEGPLQVLGAGANGTATADGLGILNVAGVSADSFNGSTIPNTISTPAATTLGQVVDRINQQSGGAVLASIAEDGVSLKLTDTTGGSGNLFVQSTAGNPHAAALLGINTGDGGVASSEVAGKRLVAHLGSVLVRNLNGGAGLQGESALSITDRAGNAMQIEMATLKAFHSLDQIFAAINEQAASEGVAISAALNSSGTGLRITDHSGSTASNLVIAGDGAAALGIEADVAKSSLHGSNLQHKYIGVATKLDDLSYGKGIGNGSFRITDGFGKTATININSNQKTLYDVIQVINAQAGGPAGLAIKARVNDTGSGLLIEADYSGLEPGAMPFAPIKVESLSGSAAKDLGILGQSKSIADNPHIDGSYQKTIELDPSYSLSKVVEKINAAKLPLTASILNTGSGSSPFRLNLTSGIGGKVGELVIDSGGADLGLTTLAKGQDAKVYFGSPEQGGFLITSQSNTVKDVVEGVTLNLHSAGGEPVTVTISRDTEKIVQTVHDFVKAINDAIERINSYDYYDLEKEKRGVLLGNPTTARVRAALFRAVNQRVEGVSTQYQFLRDVGIRVGSGGKVDFNEAQFLAAYENDPAAVENLFAAFESSTQTSEEIAPGVTVQSSTTQATSRGIGAIFEDLLKGLTDPADGTLALADRNFSSQIDLARSRVEAFQVRLDAKRQRLERQFAAMEAALARFQGQGNAINGLLNNVMLANQSLMG